MTGDRRWTIAVTLPVSGRPSTVCCLLIPVGDSASRQIIRRHLYAYTVADQNTNSVFAHLAGNRCQHHMLSVVELNFEESVRLFVDDGAFCWNQIVSCQYVLLCKYRPMTVKGTSSFSGRPSSVMSFGSQPSSVFNCLPAGPSRPE